MRACQAQLDHSWTENAATNDVIIPYKDRYFYKTGDEGEIKDGYLFYKGRISENYKLSNGKFVNIGEIENTIKEHISQTFIVYGNNKDYNIIICEEDCKITDELLSKINNSLDSYLRIKKILYLENGTFQKYMTPKMSIKRKEIEKDYKIKIEKMYQSQ